MENVKSIKLTEGAIGSTLLKLAIPIMGSAFLGTAYNLMDMAWIGLLGSKAVAGVGVGGMFTWLSQGVATLPRMGGQVYVAQFIGQNKLDEAKKYARSAIQMAIVLALVFSAICVVFAEPIVAAFHLEDAQTAGYAKVYLRITCGCILFSFLNLTLTGLFTAQGDSKSPLWANLSGLIINIILDPLLMLGVGPFPKMGVAGAAVATVFAQFVVMSVLLVKVRRSKYHNILQKLGIFQKNQKENYLHIIKMGGPSSIQSMVYCSISMVITRMVAVYGAGAIATFRVGGQIESLSWNTADGVAAAMNAFCAQNFGAREYQRIKKGYRYSLRFIIIWGGIITAMFLIFPQTISEIFFHEPEVIAVSTGYLKIISSSQILMSVELMTIGALSGLGETKICSIFSVLITALRIPLAVLLSLLMGIRGVWWAMSLTSIAKGVVFLFVFLRKTKKFT